MKKLFLFLAAMCCMMVSAQSLTVTYTPQYGNPVTLSEGTNDLGTYQGSITINGNNITFDNVYLPSLSEGVTITPASLTDSYSPQVTFKGHNHIKTLSSATTPAMQFMGNPNMITLAGDALYLKGESNEAPTLLAQTGSFIVGMLELCIFNYSQTHYAVEMGPDLRMSIINMDSYSRVHLNNYKVAQRVMKLPPLLFGDMQAIVEADYWWEFATIDYTQHKGRVGDFELNEGNMPFYARLMPGLKSGTATLEDGGAYDMILTLKDVEIETPLDLYVHQDINLEIKVEGTNNILTNSPAFQTLLLEASTRGNIKVRGVGKDAKLNITNTDSYYPVFYNNGFINFENLTAKLVSTEARTLIDNLNRNSDPSNNMLIVSKDAKLMLLQENPDSSSPAIIQGFTSLGSGSNVFTDPIYGSFINGNFYAEDGETPLHEVYFDSEDYHIVLNESTPVCSFNAEDVMHNGKVRYEDNTLFIDDFDLDDIIAENTLNLTGNNSEIRAIYTSELLIKNSTNFSVSEEILTEKITFEETDFHLNGEINNLDEVPTLIGCHALEYDDFKLEGGVLYGIKGETSEVVESLTIVNDMTGIHNSHVAVPATKTLLNGQVVVIRGNKTYDMLGNEVR